MIKNAFNFFVLLLSLAGTCAAGEPTAAVSSAAQIQSDANASTESAISPKLLWEKKLSKPITSSAISKDGTEIAIADETGYLTLYNIKGEKLWDYHYEGKLPKRTYEFKSDKADTAILNMKFSASGKFIVCDLGVLNTIKERHGIQNLSRYEPHKKLCFNSEGKLLWETLKRGRHEIGGDEYVLIQSGLRDEDDEEPVSYYLLDMAGQLLRSGKTCGDCDSGFSEDGRYMFAGTKLFESKTRQLLWEFHENKRGVFTKLYNKFVIVGSGRSVRVYDVPTRKKLFDIERGIYETLSANYVAAIEWPNLRVREIQTGRVVWKDNINDHKFPGNWPLGYLAKDEKHLLVGSQTVMALYDMTGKVLWKQTPEALLLPCGVRARTNFDRYYSATENTERFLLGCGESARLYKSY